MEELRTQTEYQFANDPTGLPQATAQKIINRLLRIFPTPLAMVWQKYSMPMGREPFPLHRLPPNRFRGLLFQQAHRNVFSKSDLPTYFIGYWFAPLC
jgi:hypothetical protein